MSHMSSGALYCTIASLGGRVTRDSMDIPGIHNVIRIPAHTLTYNSVH